MSKAFFTVVVCISLTACTPRGKPSPAREDRDARGADTGASSRKDDAAARRAAVEAAARAAATSPAPDRRCGYVNAQGKFVIARRFDSADNFSWGVAAVRENGKRGFIDVGGRYAFAPTFDEAKSFREGLAAGYVKGKGWGFILPNGAWAIPPTFADADSFSDGVAVVKDDPGEAADAGPHDEKEFTETPAGSECESSGDSGDDDPGKYFLIDRTGKRVSKGYPCITRMSEGLAAVWWKDKWGYVDRAGKEIIPPRFKRAKPFGQGLAAVLVARKARASDDGEGDEDEGGGGEGDRDGAWGFIDQRGKFILRPKIQAGELGVFSEGLISIEGLSSKALPASAAGRKVLASRAKKKGLTMRELAEREAEGSEEWAGYLDRKGTLRFAAPYCGFDDANPGTRSFREMSGGVAMVIMQKPKSVAPFACADALESDVMMFIDRRGAYVEPPMSFLTRLSSEQLAPKCSDDARRSGVDKFTWE